MNTPRELVLRIPSPVKLKRKRVQVALVYAQVYNLDGNPAISTNAGDAMDYLVDATTFFHSQIRRLNVDFQVGKMQHIHIVDLAPSGNDEQTFSSYAVI